jgi:hypothetical protein
MPKRILIGTPLKGDVPKSYLRSAVMVSRLNTADVQFEFVLLDGPAVMQARNEIAEYALTHNFDELIFWDKDLKLEVDGDDRTIPALQRLAAYDKDIVSFIYSTRTLKTHWHLNLMPGAVSDEQGLMKAERCSIGFSKIKTHVFRKIAEDNPDSRVTIIDPNRNPRHMTDFFPMGVYGKNTPAGRIERIRAAMEQYKDLPGIAYERISEILTERLEEPNMYISEDYQFCLLARKSGFDLHVDTRILMSHEGNVTYPIATKTLKEMLDEPWRKGGPS